MTTPPEPRRRRRRKACATGSVGVAWRAKGPMWLMKHRLPDGTESMKTIGRAWVARDDSPRGWKPKRGRPADGWLTEDAAKAELHTFLAEQTNTLPPERVTFDRCADAFIQYCEEKGRSPNTMTIPTDATRLDTTA